MHLSEIDYTAAKFWWDVFISVGLMVLGAYSWIKTRHAANAQDIDQLRIDTRDDLKDTRRDLEMSDKELRELFFSELEKRDKEIKSLERRTTEVEGEVRHMPSQAQFTELLGKLGTLHADLSKAIGGMEAINHQVQRMQAHLLNEKGGA